MGAPSADLLAVPVLLIEVALLAVALAVARVPRLLRPARWLARGLALVSLLVGLGGMLAAVAEGWTSRYPLTLPDTPFGTYARPTTLEMVQLLLTFLVVAVAALLACRRPGRAGLLFVGWGVSGALAWGLRRDPTRPPGNFAGMALTVALPALAVGSVLLATWWAGGGRPPRVARRDVLVEAGTIAALAAAWLAIVGAAAAWGARPWLAAPPLLLLAGALRRPPHGWLVALDAWLAFVLAGSVAMAWAFAATAAARWLFAAWLEPLVSLPLAWALVVLGRALGTAVTGRGRRGAARSGRHSGTAATTRAAR